MNLYGTFYCLRAAVRRMRPQGRGGSIVTVSSVGGLLGRPFLAAYPASKAGVLGLTRTSAGHLAPENIRVNSIAPGATDTAMFDPVPRERREATVDLVPMKRIASADEMANAILFLASDEASYMTGQTVSPNGGVWM